MNHLAKDTASIEAEHTGRPDPTWLLPSWRKHDPRDEHPGLFVGGSCTCGVGPICIECNTCLKCGRFDFGAPRYYLDWTVQVVSPYIWFRCPSCLFMPVEQILLPWTFGGSFRLECGEAGLPQGHEGCGRRWLNRQVEVLYIQGYQEVHEGTPFFSRPGVRRLHAFLKRMGYDHLYELDPVPVALLVGWVG